MEKKLRNDVYCIALNNFRVESVRVWGALTKALSATFQAVAKKLFVLCQRKKLGLQV